MKKVAISFDYWPETRSVAFPLMLDRGVVGTYFVQPDLIGTSGYVSRDDLIVMKMCGWTIGGYAVGPLGNTNMVTEFANNRGLALNRLQSIKATMDALGLPIKTIAPNQRAWNISLRNVCVNLFEQVRVVDLFSAQKYPFEDPLWIKGGGSNSLSSGDTAVSLNAQVDAFLANPDTDFWTIVAHKVGPNADGLTVSTTAFTALIDRLAAERSAGNLEIVGFDD